MACSAGRLGQVSPIARPSSSAPHSPSPATATAALARERRCVNFFKPRRGEEGRFSGVFIAADSRPEPDRPIKGPLGFVTKDGRAAWPCRPRRPGCALWLQVFYKKRLHGGVELELVFVIVKSVPFVVFDQIL